MNSASLSFAVALSLTAPAVHAGPIVTGGEGTTVAAGSGIAGSAMFGTVSLGEAQTLQGLILHVDAGKLSVPAGVLHRLQTLNVHDEASRMLLAPFREGLKTTRAQKVPAEFEVANALARAEKMIKTEAQNALPTTLDCELSLAQLESSNRALGRVREYVDVYYPQALSKVDTASRIAHGRIEAMKEGAAEATVEGGKQAMRSGEAPVDGPGAELIAITKGGTVRTRDRNVVEAVRLVNVMQKSERRPETAAHRYDLVLKAAFDSSSEGVQRVVARGIAADLATATGNSDVQPGIAALKELGRMTSFDAVREIAINGIVDRVKQKTYWEGQLHEPASDALVEIVVGASESYLGSRMRDRVVETLDAYAVMSYSDSVKSELNRGVERVRASKVKPSEPPVPGANATARTPAVAKAEELVKKLNNPELRAGFILKEIREFAAKENDEDVQKTLVAGVLVHGGNRTAYPREEMLTLLWIAKKTTFEPVRAAVLAGIIGAYRGRSGHGGFSDLDSEAASAAFATAVATVGRSASTEGTKTAALDFLRGEYALARAKSDLKRSLGELIDSLQPR